MVAQSRYEPSIGFLMSLVHNCCLKQGEDLSLKWEDEIQQSKGRRQRVDLHFAILEKSKMIWAQI